MERAMRKLNEIKAKLDNLYGQLEQVYGHECVVEDEKTRLIGVGINIGKERGYKSGFEAGFAEGFAEGKIFPDAHQSAPSIDDARMRLTRTEKPG